MSFMQNKPARQVMELAFSGNKGPNARSPEELSALMAQFRASPGIKTSPSRNPLLAGQQPWKPEIMYGMGDQNIFQQIAQMQTPQGLQAPQANMPSWADRIGNFSNQMAGMGGSAQMYQPEMYGNVFADLFKRGR